MTTEERPEERPEAERPMTYCAETRSIIDLLYNIPEEEWTESDKGLVERQTGGTCLKPKDHDGEHEFTPDDEISASLMFQ